MTLEDKANFLKNFVEMINRLMRENHISFEDQKTMWNHISELKIGYKVPNAFMCVTHDPTGFHHDLSKSSGIIEAYEHYSGDNKGYHVDEFAQKIFDLCYEDIQCEYIPNILWKYTTWNPSQTQKEG